MISDKEFKSLKHYCKGYVKHLNGQSLEDGYKPDYVLKKGNDFVILESENSSSRKMFVGGLMKAAHYLQGEKTGILIFVIVPKKNTRSASIHSHLKKYFYWLQGKTNLRAVYVIEADQYFKDDVLKEILSPDFNSLAHSIFAS